MKETEENIRLTREDGSGGWVHLHNGEINKVVLSAKRKSVLFFSLSLLTSMSAVFPPSPNLNIKNIISLKTARYRVTHVTE
jgi:hypothetical protein